MEFCLRRYRFVVLDVPRTSPAMLDALDEVSAIVVVVTQDVAAVRSAARLVRNLGDRYGNARIRVVINRFDSRSELGRSEVERAVGSPVAHVMSADSRSALEALNLGRPVVTGHGNGFAQEIRALAASLAGNVKKQSDTSSGLFARLVLRRA